MCLELVFLIFKNVFEHNFDFSKKFQKVARRALRTAESARPSRWSISRKKLFEKACEQCGLVRDIFLHFQKISIANTHSYNHSLFEINDLIAVTNLLLTTKKTHKLTQHQLNCCTNVSLKRFAEFLKKIDLNFIVPFRILCFNSNFVCC